MQRFDGRAALVTGGGSGIGRAVAVCLGAEGADVAVADIDPHGGGETCRLLEQQGGRSCYSRADVTVARDCERMVGQTVEAFGRLDVLFPSAGVGAGGTVAHILGEEWDRLRCYQGRRCQPDPQHGRGSRARGYPGELRLPRLGSDADQPVRTPEPRTARAD